PGAPYAIVPLLGRGVTTPVDPGLTLKLPFSPAVGPIDTRLREWDGESSDLLTLEKENIEVNTWGRWRVTDPLKFYEALRSEVGAQSVLDGLVDASTKNVISAYELIEVVRTTARRLRYKSKELEEAEAAKKLSVNIGREKIVGQILDGAAKDTQDEYGFAFVGVGIKHLNYAKATVPKIYERMRSERIRIANRYESEGREREEKILGEMTKTLEEISSEGYREAARIRGQADAKVLKIYADAYGQDSDFYSFSRSLELLPKTFSRGTRLILGTDDNDLMKYIKSYRKGGDRSPPPRLRILPSNAQ
ncbi:MAG: protease modulator HflC, partial [Myxococcota bacterium]|nr:protease modulator HflC [Myxococcota bacterium]